MVHPLPPLIIILLLIAALVLGSAPVAGADAIPLSCPNGATVLLQGQAPPNEALLAYLNKRSVGGGSSDRNGRYRIPLKLRERPGIYPVEVRLRSSGGVVGRYECYVDVPLVEQPTATPEIVVTSPSNPPPTLTPQPTARGATSPALTPTPRATTPAGRTATSAARTPSPTTPTGGNPAPTVATEEPSPTTEQVAAGNVQIFDVVLASTGNPDEYLTMENLTSTPIDIGGWRIVNTSRADQPTYIFPEYQLEDNGVVDLYTGVGNDNEIPGIFYWNRNDTVWRVGDVAELRDSSNRLIFSYIVAAS